MSQTAKVLGKLGKTLSHQQLQKTRWDVIIVGAGHNGLTCGAYLASAGKKVLILEAKDRVGGACTLEEISPGVRVSPCAYVMGLFHDKIIKELKLKERGLTWFPATGGMFVPFPDGDHLQLWNDGERCEAEIKRVAPKDVSGWRAMGQLIAKVRDAIRPDSDEDLWLDPRPTRQKIEDRLKHIPHGQDLLFHWSMSEFLEHFTESEKLHMAYYGQGVIGTNASPTAKGTASIYFHHASGRTEGMPGTWGFVKGGMGMVSFLLCDAARELGVTINCETPVNTILPGEGVKLTDGTLIKAPTIISNADPQVTLRLLANAADSRWKQQVEEIPTQGPTVKVNLSMSELPNFRACPGVDEPHHKGQANTPLTKKQWNRSFQMASEGEIPESVWNEIYFHTAYDPSVTDGDTHTVSVFSQYFPYKFKQGSWEENRPKVQKKILDTLSQYCSNIDSATLMTQTLGPPDIESQMGLTGGHIFQGECLPNWMWEKRLTSETPMTGVYLCGAGTHPGGSVMGVNGRNAAMVVLENNS